MRFVGTASAFARFAAARRSPSDISENLPPKRKLFRLRRSDPLGPKVLAKPPCGLCNPQSCALDRSQHLIAQYDRPQRVSRRFSIFFQIFEKKNFPPRIVVQENFLFAESSLDNTFVKKKSGCYIVYDIRL
jgi:hypothetical protein